MGKISWRRKWQTMPIFLPGKSHGQRSLAGYSPRGQKESDTTEQLNNNNHQNPTGRSSFSMELQGAELKQGKLAKFLLWLHDYFQWLEMSSRQIHCPQGQALPTIRKIMQGVCSICMLGVEIFHPLSHVRAWRSANL